MIKLPTFVDLHTHTRYPDNSNFPSQDIERAALNGGYSEILAMANSEIPIDSVENLKLAREIDQNLNIKVHRVASLTENLEGKKLINFSEFINEGIRIFSDDGKSLVELLSGESNKSPHKNLFFYYNQNELHSIRHHNWKYYFPHKYRSLNGREGKNLSLIHI